MTNMLTKKMTKKIGIIGFLLVMVITVLGIGVAVYAAQHSRAQQTVVASASVEAVVAEGQEVQEEVTPEEEEEYLKYLEEEEEKEEEEVEPSSLPYYIKVNYQAQTVTVYGKDENGEYTKPVIAFVCSTGTDTPTSGVYPLKAKYRWINLKGNVYGQYSSRIVGSILFHSAYYYEKFNPSTLCYTGYDKLGTKASAGCIRLNVASAKWIYDNCPVGTKVEFYASSNPGPLGKPSSQKISSNEACRGWDPTDPDPANPWHTYVESTVQQEPVVTPTPDPTPTPEPTPDPTPTPEPNVSITDVLLNKDKLVLKKGESEMLQVIIQPENADIAKTEWNSSNQLVATVDSNGKIVAMDEGEANITVTVTDQDGKVKTKTCTVTVMIETEENEIGNEMT